MSNFFSKGKVKVAQQSKANKFDLSHSHITTMDFFQPRPVFTTMLKPKDSLDVDLTLVSRLSPLVKPMFGDIRFVNRAFFVPLRILSPDFMSFIEGTTSISSLGAVTQPKVAPYIANNVIVKMFADKSSSPTAVSPDTLSIKHPSSSSPSDNSYDFVYSASSTPGYYKFTKKGKIFFNILVGLGYKLNFGIGQGSFDNTKFKAFPLLAYCKLHFDWLRNPAYSTFVGIEKYFVNSYTELNSDDAFALLNASYKICYSSDLFTSAWDNPINPNNDNITPQLSVDDLAAFAGQTGNVSSGNQSPMPIYQPAQVNPGEANAVTVISDYMLQILHKMTDFVKRKQLVGSRVLDRYKADYGIELDSAKLDRSLYLGKIDTPVSISDITQSSPDLQNGNSTDVGLGDYSGKGFSASANKLCKFTTDEWGIFIVLSYVEPRNSYPFGRNRQIIGVNREDFFLDEFDAIGTQPIRVDELSALNFKSTNFGSTLPNSIFGFAPRYNEYKCIQDSLSGDFLLDTKNESLSGWYLSRDFRRDHVPSSLLLHSLAFTEGSSESFNNIWQYNGASDSTTTNIFDHFFCRFIFNVTKYSHMKNMYDYHDFESDGKEMLMNINGTQITQ